ncbi:MAG: class I adenylate-forming enzyme family protein [Waterburya sp.]
MNIAHHVERGHILFPHKVALIFEEKSFTYQHLDQLASRVAYGLRGLGIKQGDRVALFLPNIPEFIISYLGILKLGAIAVSVNVMFKSEEVSHVLNDCAAKIVITTEAQCKYVSIADLPQLEQIIIAEGESEQKLSLEQLMANADSRAKAVAVERNTPASIVYTSGTTGFSKGATLSHGNVISNMYAQNRCCRMTADDKLLLYLPLFHCFGQNAILNAGLNACATIVLQRRFELEQVLKNVTVHNVTMFFGVPTVFIKLLKADISPQVFQSIRYYFSAAASMPVAVVQHWQSEYGLTIHEGYGLTETSPCACYNHDLQYKFGSVGMPIENVEMKIVDVYGEQLPPGELGEIAIRGPNVMLGYWNRPQATAQAIKNGWFHTGDLGRIDEQGFFYIVDRLKDMINMSGFKVYPNEVEQVIYQHPAVAEVAIYGVPDPEKGEIVKANIVAKNSKQSITALEIKEFCSQRLANYKIPREISFVADLPKNPTGKILKRVLRQEAASPKLDYAQNLEFVKA